MSEGKRRSVEALVEHWSRPLGENAPVRVSPIDVVVAECKAHVLHDAKAPSQHECEEVVIVLAARVEALEGFVRLAIRNNHHDWTCRTSYYDDVRGHEDKCDCWVKDAKAALNGGEK